MGRAGRAESFAQLTVAVSGSPDEARLAAALSAAVAAHESLRTTFTGLAGRTAPVQIVQEPGAVPLPVTALPASCADGSGPELDALRAAEREALDPQAGPLLRAVLARAGDSRALLVLTAHALVADRVSLCLLVRQLVAAYGGDAAPNPEPPLQYADFAAWHNDLLTAEDSAADRAFWTAHAPRAAAHLPGVTRTDPGSPGHGDWRDREITLTPETAAGIGRIAKSLSTGPDAVLHAAFRVMVRRLTGDGTLPVALTRDGRTYEELRRAVGAFERDMPLVLDTDPGLAVHRLRPRPGRARPRRRRPPGRLRPRTARRPRRPRRAAPLRLHPPDGRDAGRRRRNHLHRPPPGDGHPRRPRPADRAPGRRHTAPSPAVRRGPDRRDLRRERR
ncbi:condensation domain-containing protein [Streptomyces stramineus]